MVASLSKAVFSLTSSGSKTRRKSPGMNRVSGVWGPPCVHWEGTLSSTEAFDGAKHFMSTRQGSDGGASPSGRQSGLELRPDAQRAASPVHHGKSSQKGPCAERFAAEQLPYPSDFDEATAWTAAATNSGPECRIERSTSRGRHRASWLATHDAVPDLVSAAPWLSLGDNTLHSQAQPNADAEPQASSLSTSTVQKGQAAGGPSSGRKKQSGFRRASWLAVHEAVPDFNRIQEVTSQSSSQGALRPGKLDHSSCASPSPKEPLSPASPGANPTYEGPLLLLQRDSTQRMEAGAAAESPTALGSRELTSDRLSDCSSQRATSGLASSVKSVSSRLVAWITRKGPAGTSSPTQPAHARRPSSRASRGDYDSPDNGEDDEDSKYMRRSVTSNHAAAASADEADAPVSLSAQSILQHPRSKPSPEPSKLRTPDPPPNILAPAMLAPPAQQKDVRPGNLPDGHSSLRSLDQRLGCSMDRRLAASGRFKLLMMERQSDMPQTLDEHLPNQVQD